MAVTHGTFVYPLNAATIRVEYPVLENIGDLQGRYGLDVTLVEHRSIFQGSDRDWAKYTSRRDHPDDVVSPGGSKPGLLIDWISEVTERQFKTAVRHSGVTIQPGVRVSFLPSLIFTLPGTNQGPAMVDFWDDQDGATEFQVKIWLFELDSQGFTIRHNGDNGSIDHLKLERAFRLED